MKFPGVCKANDSAKTEVSLRDVRLENLKRFPDMEILYQQAVKAGWFRRSEANFLNFVSASVRANTVSVRDPVRVFLNLVKYQRWEFITQRQEDRARVVITRYREAVSRRGLNGRVVRQDGNHYFNSVEATRDLLSQRLRL